MPSLKDKTVLMIGRGSGIARAMGGYQDLTANLVNASFSVKVTGPLLLAKHLAGNVAPGGSFLFMSGATALKPAPGMLAVAAANAAVDAVTAGLAVELAPIRVNAIAPGTIDTGASVPVDGGEHLV